MIFECKRISRHLVVPVFYQAEPSDVRYETGSIKEALIGTKRNSRRKLMKKVKKNGWKR